MEYLMLICRDPLDDSSRRELVFQAVSLHVRNWEDGRRTAAETAELRRTAKGKPYLTDAGSGEAVPDLQFSISHSGGFWACLMGPASCGLDIQANRPADYMKLAERYFSPAEQLYVQEEGREGFYRLWCRREALAKYTGLGFFGMSGEDGNGERPELADFAGTEMQRKVRLKPCIKWEDRNVWFHETDFEEGFTAVWCSEGEDDEVRCIR